MILPPFRKKSHRIFIISYDRNSYIKKIIFIIKIANKVYIEFCINFNFYKY